VNDTTVLVLADPQGGYLKPLAKISSPVRIVVSNQVDLALGVCPEADVILDAAPAELLRIIFPHATRLRWLHSLKAGVETILFPEVVTSPVVLTCARGVHKGPLMEFVMTGVLFFSKDVGRLLRNQRLGRWEQFDAEEARGKVIGIVGYGETGRVCARLARALGMTVLALRRHPELSRSDSVPDRVFGPDGLLEMLSLCDYVVL
jgi:phosphoglycerate dehydrogenase-like enzyme